MGTRARLERNLVLDTLKMVLGRRKPSYGLIHHSDRGSQSASQDFQKVLKAHGIRGSIRGTGNCYSNGVAESFFALLKRERGQVNASLPY